MIHEPQHIEVKDPEEITVVVDSVDDILDHANQPTTPAEEQLSLIDRLRDVFKRDRGE